MRLRNNPNAKNLLENSNIIANTFPILVNQDTILELGIGKGEMISQLALEYPQKNFIGVEKYPTVLLKAMKLIEKNRSTNVTLILGDVSHLNELFNGKISELWLTFSDPWPKARHYKRRLTHKTYLDKYCHILNEKGVLKFKTDNDKLFEYSLESLRENGWIIQYQTNDLHSSEKNKNNKITGHELKWSQKGKNINYLEASSTKNN